MNNTEKYGIETVKEIVREICIAANEISIATADGKMSFLESVYLSDNVVKLAMYYSQRKQLILELSDISGNEAKEISELIQTETHNMKDKVKKALDLITQYYILVNSNRASVSMLFSKTNEFINLFKNKK